MLFDEFGEDFVFALQACLQVGNFSFFGVGIGLASLVVRSEGGGAVLEEGFLPQVEEVDGDAVFLADLGDGNFSTRCCRSRATFCSGPKWRRCCVMNVPPREYCR
jgi:hypothetical protein